MVLHRSHSQVQTLWSCIGRTPRFRPCGPTWVIPPGSDPVVQPRSQPQVQTLWSCIGRTPRSLVALPGSSSRAQPIGFIGPGPVFHTRFGSVVQILTQTPAPSPSTQRWRSVVLSASEAQHSLPSARTPQLPVSSAGSEAQVRPRQKRRPVPAQCRSSTGSPRPSSEAQVLAVDGVRELLGATRAVDERQVVRDLPAQVSQLLRTTTQPMTCGNVLPHGEGDNCTSDWSLHKCFPKLYKSSPTATSGKCGAGGTQSLLPNLYFNSSGAMCVDGFCGGGGRAASPKSNKWGFTVESAVQTARFHHTGHSGGTHRLVGHHGTERQRPLVVVHGGVQQP